MEGGEVHCFWRRGAFCVDVCGTEMGVNRVVGEFCFLEMDVNRRKILCVPEVGVNRNTFMECEMTGVSKGQRT